MIGNWRQQPNKPTVSWGAMLSLTQSRDAHKDQDAAGDRSNTSIAALAGVTCVVGARRRSGALNTAHHAESITRHVAAVAGSVHSANSAGCHRFLKEGGAVLVSAAERTELLASLGPAPTSQSSAVPDQLCLRSLLAAVLTDCPCPLSCAECDAS